MNIVYAVDTRHIGNGLTVRKGSHWPANDPVVHEHPGLFSPDPRFGLTYSPEAVPREMAYAPGEAIPDEGAPDPSTMFDEIPDEAPIEQATAAPGERRNTRRRPHAAGTTVEF